MVRWINPAVDWNLRRGLELQDFPLDRQLCRVRILSQKPIEEWVSAMGLPGKLRGGLSFHVFLFFFYRGDVQLLKLLGLMMMIRRFDLFFFL